MSDDERAFSDEEDLFGSESEEQGSDIEHSLDVPSLSIDSLYVRSPLPAEDHDDGGTPFEHSVREIDQSDAGGFDIDGVVSSAADVAQTEDELDPLEERHEDNPPGKENDKETRRSSRSGDDASEKAVGRAELDTMKLSSDEIPHCESPRMRKADDQLEVGENEQQVQDDDRVSTTEENVDNTRITDVLHDVLAAKSTSPTDESDETRDPSLLTTSVCEGKAPSCTESGELAAKPEAFTAERSLEITQQSEENAVAKPSPREIPGQQTDATAPSVTAPVESVAKAPVYTVESLFPVVYEERLSPRALQPQSEKVPFSISSTDTQRPNRERRRQVSGSNPEKSLACRLAALQSKLDRAHTDLANTNRTHKLHLSMVETDNNKLTQRNARLKTQLSVTTADLQRSNAELAKLKTENELYAAKLPQLQAELLQETSQVDETQAQSVQTQLALTQLKARSHVLQTRTLSLETQNNKLTQQLRECQQQLMRKTVALVQQTEKANRMEADVNKLKTTHGQDKLEWKHRLTTALQRFEHDKAKLEAQTSSKERKELREAKDRAEKAAAKRRAAEAADAKMEEQLKHQKRELAAANDTIHRQVAEVRTLEALLRKAHRTEATLRNDLAACKTKVRSLQDEKMRPMARSAPIQIRRRQLKQQIPIELLLPLTDSSDDEESNQEDQPCHCPRSKVEPQSPFVCTDCPRLQDQLRQLQQDLCRVRSLHSAELHAQASVLASLLQVQQQQVAHV